MNDDPDLEGLLDDGMEEIRAALDASDDELTDEAVESVRESADAVAEGVSDASLDELLATAGLENESDDVTPADLPLLMQDADADAVLDLRRLLELADLSDEWEDLDAEDRIDQFERIGGEETGRDSDRSVSDLFSSVFSTGGSEEGATGDDAGEEGETEGKDEAEGEEGESSTEGAVEEFRSLIDSIAGDDSDGGATDETDAAETDGSESGGPGRGRGRATDRYSTVPSSRSDMGSRDRHSTVRGKN